jgi:RNA 2',3'-cyclic 3'-phosphodiesterase
MSGRADPPAGGRPSESRAGAIARSSTDGRPGSAECRLHLPGAEATARLFFALDLPDGARDALVAWRGALLARETALRPVPAAALHVTLCFLGERPAEAIEPLGELVARCAAPVEGLALGAPLWLPRRRPRLLAVALDDRHGELGALQERLMDALVAGGWAQPETRPYLPHVTVARVRRGEAPRAGGELEPPTPCAFGGAAVALYRSHLGRGPARYEALRRAELA